MIEFTIAVISLAVLAFFVSSSFMLITLLRRTSDIRESLSFLERRLDAMGNTSRTEAEKAPLPEIEKPAKPPIEQFPEEPTIQEEELTVSSPPIPSAPSPLNSPFLSQEVRPQEKTVASGSADKFTYPEASEFEKRTEAILDAISDWLIVGEAWRPKSLPKEYAVAAVQLLRGAVLLFLIGLGFLVKYVHEAGLFPPEMRLIAGGAAAVALVVFGAIMLRRQYRLVGMGISGLGFALGYFIAFAGFTLYRLIGVETAFGIAGALSFVAAVFAVKFESQLLGIVGLAGGYLAPLLFRTGNDDLAGLSLWLVMITGVAAVLCALRKWPVTVIFGMAAVWLWGGAMCSRFEVEIGREVTVNLLLYSAAVFILMHLAIVFRNWLRGIESSAFEVAMIIANTSVAMLLLNYVARLHIARHMPTCMEYSALVPAGLAVWHILAVLFSLTGRCRDRILMMTCEVMACALLGIAAAFAFDGAVLVAVWSAFALVMLFLGVRFAVRAFLVEGSLLLLAAFIALIQHWVSVPFMSETVTARLVSYGSLTAALFIAGVILLRRYSEAAEKVFALAVMALFIYSNGEVYCFMKDLWPNFRGGLSIWWGIFALTMLAAGLKTGSVKLRGAALVLFAATGAKILLIDLEGQPTLYRICGLIAVGVAMLAGSFMYLRSFGAKPR